MAVGDLGSHAVVVGWFLVICLGSDRKQKEKKSDYRYPM